MCKHTDDNGTSNDCNACNTKDENARKHNNGKDKENEEIIEDFFGKDKYKLVTFVSIDMCDSTKLKRKILNWQEVVIKFLDDRPSFLRDENLLKAIGDELVYYFPGNNLNRIITIMLDVARNNFHLHKKLTNLAGEDIFVKATVWVARVGYKDDLNAENIAFVVKGFDKLDFSGTNIDEGFRLSGYSEKSMLTVDPKIVMAAALVKEQLGGNNNFDDLSFEIPKNFADSINVFKTRLDDKDIIVRNSYAKVKGYLDSFMSNIFLDKYESPKNVWYDKEDGVKNYYPVFKYCDMECSDEVASIIRDRYDGLNKKNKKNYQQYIPEIIKKLSDDFQRARVNKTMQLLLELMPFEL